MNRTLALLLAAGLTSTTIAFAQAPAAAAAPAPEVKPEAIPAKVAIIAFTQAVFATNEGQAAVAAVQKKYEPKKASIETLGNEVDSLKKQLQALPANTSDEERANRMKAIDAKEKQLNRDIEDAQNAYQGDLQDAYDKVSQKVGPAAVKYSQDNGFTLLINYVPASQNMPPSPFIWWDAKSDITQAVINAYNTSSGVAAPAPSAPSARRPSAPARPAPTTPKR